MILNARGEADIYTNVALKLVFTIPGGDPTSPIWVVDYVGEMQDSRVAGDAIPVTANNNYVVTTTPAVSVLTLGFELIMNPDVDNTDTIGTTTFTGTGVNDLAASGPYLGTTSGSIFSVVIDATVQATPVAPGAVLSATAGIVTAGVHSFKLTAVTTGGETLPGSASNNVVADGSHKIDVAGIPAVGGEITGYNLYMNKAGGSIWYLVNTTPITTITYAANIADATLGTGVHVAAPTSNTTGAGSADTFKWKKDGWSWVTGVAITSSAQILIEGFTVTFASLTGHIEGDIWTITVTTPTRVDLDGLGNFLVYKNKGALIVPIDGGDFKAGYPAEMLVNASLNGWLLINPTTPVLVSPTLTAERLRNNLTADYTLQLSDQGKELSCIGTFTVTLLPCPQFAGHFVYIRNTGNGRIVIGGNGYLIKGYGSVTGRNSFTLAQNIECIQLATDGIDWHILTMVIANTSGGGGITGGFDVFTVPGTYTWTAPEGVVSVEVVKQGGGGGGGGSSGADLFGMAGSPGDTVTETVTVVPLTDYTVKVGTGGAGGDGATAIIPTDGSAGGASKFVASGSTDAAGGAGGAAGIGTSISDTVPTGNGGAGGSYYYGGYPGGSGSVSISY